MIMHKWGTYCGGVALASAIVSGCETNHFVLADDVSGGAGSWRGRLPY